MDHKQIQLNKILLAVWEFFYISIPLFLNKWTILFNKLDIWQTGVDKNFMRQYWNLLPVIAKEQELQK